MSYSPLNVTKDLEDSAWAAIVLALDGLLAPDHVVWARQSAPRPSKPYVTLLLLSGPSRIGLGDERRELSPDENLVVGQRELTLTVEAYGDGAPDLVAAVEGHLQKPSVRGAMGRPEGAVVVVAVVTPLATYQINVDGIAASYVASAMPTAQEIRDGLVAAINVGDLLAIAAAEAAPAELSLAGTSQGPHVVALSVGLTRTERAAGVDLVSTGSGGSLDLSDVVDSYWERRQSIDLFLLYESTQMEAESGAIESIEGAGALDGGQQPITASLEA